VRIVALEEHFNVPSLVARIPQDVIRQRGFPPPEEMPPMMAGPQAKLKDLGAGRLADMDAAGITVQVLSVSGPGADLLPPQESISWARQANDVLAKAIIEHPDRYSGFAHLPMRRPTNWSDRSAPWGWWAR
jgi:hypothetical protein